TAVIVAGSWGTALASVLADNGQHVAVWSRNETRVRDWNETHRRSNLYATASMEEAMAGVQAVIVVSPSSAMRQVAAQIRPFLNETMLLIHATKGFEAATLKRMSTVLAEELPDYDP